MICDRTMHEKHFLLMFIQPCVLHTERRKQALERVKFPEYDGHYVCLKNCEKLHTTLDIIGITSESRTIASISSYASLTVSS